MHLKNALMNLSGLKEVRHMHNLCSDVCWAAFAQQLFDLYSVWINISPYTSPFGGLLSLQKINYKLRFIWLYKITCFLHGDLWSYMVIILTVQVSFLATSYPKSLRPYFTLDVEIFKIEFCMYFKFCVILYND